VTTINEAARGPAAVFAAALRTVWNAAGAPRARKRRQDAAVRLIQPNGTLQTGLLRPDGTWAVTSYAANGAARAAFIGRYDFATRSFLPLSVNQG
jgi:hypothetical protein